MPALTDGFIKRRVEDLVQKYKIPEALATAVVGITDHLALCVVQFRADKHEDAVRVSQKMFSVTVASLDEYLADRVPNFDKICLDAYERACLHIKAESVNFKRDPDGWLKDHDKP